MVYLVRAESDKAPCLFSRRVFILGPSHHVPLSRCALTPADVYRTPLYDLRIDQKGTPALLLFSAGWCVQLPKGLRVTERVHKFLKSNVLQLTLTCWRLGCLRRWVCRRMKMSTVLKCTCLTPLKPWRGNAGGIVSYLNWKCWLCQSSTSFTPFVIIKLVPLFLCFFSIS